MHKASALILLVVGLLGISNLFLVEEEGNAEALRCEMFQIYADTNGEYGWPPKSNPDASARCTEKGISKP